jgi:hypothetical protein
MGVRSTRGPARFAPFVRVVCAVVMSVVYVRVCVRACGWA